MVIFTRLAVKLEAPAVIHTAGVLAGAARMVSDRSWIPQSAPKPYNAAGVVSPLGSEKISSDAEAPWPVNIVPLGMSKGELRGYE